MTMRVKFLVLGVVLSLGGASARADMAYGDGGAALTGLLDSLTVSPHAGLSSVDVEKDPLADGADKWWHMTASGASCTTLIAGSGAVPAGAVFGVYDLGDPGKMVPLFGGGAVPGDQSFLAIKSTGKVYVNCHFTGTVFSSGWFGYYLDTRQPTGGGNLWYSDTRLNDGEDHMVALRGTNTDTVQLPEYDPGLWTNDEYILAFEDLPLSLSSDYQDFVVMVESVKVPVPAAALLGFLGLGTAGLRLRKHA